MNYHQTRTLPDIRRRLSIAAVAALTVLFSGTPADATNYTWANPFSGNWQVSSNWTPDSGPPGFPAVAGDVARFSGSLPVTTTLQFGSVTVGRISLIGVNAATWSINGFGTSIALNNSGLGATISNTSFGIGNYMLDLQSSVSLTLQDNLRISNFSGSTAALGSISLASAISGTGGVAYFNVSNNPSSGAISVSGNNTYTGTTFIDGGAVVFLSNSAFGSSANTLNLGASGAGSVTLMASGTNTSVANNIVVTSGTGGTTQFGSLATSSTNTYSGTITLNQSATVSTGGNNNTVALTNTISGAGGLIKTGNGTVTLSGAGNSYAGGTTISAGTLNVNSTNATGSGAVNVNAGTLGGTGSINLTSNTMTVASGANFSPGTNSSPAVVFAVSGTQTVPALGNSTVNLLAGSNFVIDLTSSAYDQLNLTGTIDITGSNLVLNLETGYTPTIGSMFTIINNDGADPVLGIFAQGAAIIVDNQLFTINYLGGSGNDVVLTAAIPEPSTTRMIGAAAALLLALQCWRRRPLFRMLLARLVIIPR